MADSKTIEFHVPALTEAQVMALRVATCSRYSSLFPPTFVTLFRRSEFEWLDRMKVDMRELLHTEQEYEYRHPLQLGDELVVRTSVQDVRERAAMRFVTLNTEIVRGGEVAVVVYSTFVLRSQAVKEKA